MGSHCRGESLVFPLGLGKVGFTLYKSVSHQQYQSLLLMALNNSLFVRIKSVISCLEKSECSGSLKEASSCSTQAVIGKWINSLERILGENHILVEKSLHHRVTGTASSCESQGEKAAVSIRGCFPLWLLACVLLLFNKINLCGHSSVAQQAGEMCSTHVPVSF